MWRCGDVAMWRCAIAGIAAVRRVQMNHRLLCAADERDERDDELEACHFRTSIACRPQKARSLQRPRLVEESLRDDVQREIAIVVPGPGDVDHGPVWQLR